MNKHILFEEGRSASKSGPNSQIGANGRCEEKCAHHSFNIRAFAWAAKSELLVALCEGERERRPTIPSTYVVQERLYTLLHWVPNTMLQQV